MQFTQQEKDILTDALVSYMDYPDMDEDYYEEVKVLANRIKSDKTELSKWITCFNKKETDALNRIIEFASQTIGEKDEPLIGVLYEKTKWETFQQKRYAIVIFNTPASPSKQRSSRKTILRWLVILLVSNLEKFWKYQSKL